ncbi:MAG: Uncharacterised protein [Marinobacterium sp. xm-d-530]|nr:MAG: Uncharacterised protein [Marinobacterium sp. xm-d-530]
MTPAEGDGTSIEALSVSRVIKLSPSATLSPSLTNTSITSTSDAPLRSGINTDSTPPDEAAAGGTDASTGAAADEDSTVAATGAGADAPVTSSSISRSPSLTLSPSAIVSALTTPDAGEGTSIDALSVSRVIRLSPSETVSPTATNTSITSTSDAPLRSGIRTCSTVDAAATGAADSTAAETDSTASGSATGSSADTDSEEAISISINRSPSLTVSPSEMAIDTILPACGEGTSIEALSVSSVIRLSPSATTSPAATRTSITSTSVAPLRSGMFTVIVLTVISLRILQSSQST